MVICYGHLWLNPRSFVHFKKQKQLNKRLYIERVQALKMCSGAFKSSVSAVQVEIIEIPVMITDASLMNVFVLG